jgi:transcriptional regulator with XRE-family HTH domain
LTYPLDSFILLLMTPEGLKTWRKSRGYTQAALARALGVIPLTVTRWETGARQIPPFLHLALRCLELEGGEPIEGKQKQKGGTSDGKRI